MYVTGNMANQDLIHIFINHWPSRREGEVESEPKRIKIAGLVRKNRRNFNQKPIKQNTFNGRF